MFFIKKAVFRVGFSCHLKLIIKFMLRLKPKFFIFISFYIERKSNYYPIFFLFRLKCFENDISKCQNCAIQINEQFTIECNAMLNHFLHFELRSVKLN